MLRRFDQLSRPSRRGQLIVHSCPNAFDPLNGCAAGNKRPRVSAKHKAQSAFVRITVRAGACACDIRSGNAVAVRSDCATRLLIVVVPAIQLSIRALIQAPTCVPWVCALHVCVHAPECARAWMGARVCGMDAIRCAQYVAGTLRQQMGWRTARCAHLDRTATARRRRRAQRY